MQLLLFAGVTLVVHVFLAALIGAHAEITGYNQWRWAPIVLCTGVIGLALYLFQNEPPKPAGGEPETEPPAAPEPPDRSHRRRLADPNTLHLELPDGTTLTGSERAAVGALLEEATDRTGGNGSESEGTDDPIRPTYDIDWSAVDTGAVLDTVFAEHDAGYSSRAVWWTDRLLPALDALPDVPTPPDADEYTLDFRVRERPHDGESRRFLVDDGDRSAVFLHTPGHTELVDTETADELTPAWLRLAKAEIAEATGGDHSARDRHAEDTTTARESDFE